LPNWKVIATLKFVSISGQNIFIQPIKYNLVMYYSRDTPVLGDSMLSLISWQIVRGVILDNKSRKSNVPSEKTDICLISWSKWKKELHIIIARQLFDTVKINLAKNGSFYSSKWWINAGGIMMCMILKLDKPRIGC